MANRSTRKWAIRAGTALLMLLAAAVAYAGWNWSGLTARHAAYRLRTSASCPPAATT